MTKTLFSILTCFLASCLYVFILDEDKIPEKMGKHCMVVSLVWSDINSFFSRSWVNWHDSHGYTPERLLTHYIGHLKTLLMIFYLQIQFYMWAVSTWGILEFNKALLIFKVILGEIGEWPMATFRITSTFKHQGLDSCAKYNTQASPKMRSQRDLSFCCLPCEVYFFNYS